MTKELIESQLLHFLQRKIGIYNQNNKLLKSGKLTLLNIREYTVQFIFTKPTGIFNYEIPYPFGAYNSNGILTLDYKLNTLSKNDDIVNYKFLIHTPNKKNKFYDTLISIKEL